jgi:hypothetical protein
LRAAGRVLAALGWALCLAGAAQAQALTVGLDEATGLPRLSKGGDAMTAQPVFWGKGWKWVGTESQVAATTALDLSVKLRVDDLGLAGIATVKRLAPDTLGFSWTFDATRAVPDAIGGGIMFRFDLAAFGGSLGEPTVLPGNRGWAWGKPGGERVEMRFDPPLATVYAEPGSQREIRAFFYRDGLPAGQRAHTATLTMSGGVGIEQPLSERLGLSRLGQWPAHPMSWSEVSVDLSFLNEGDRPAGKRGFVRAAGERLVFADGTPARFWGTNLSSYAIFSTSRENVRQQARRLARLGFNLVRMQHHDSPWAVPNVFGGEKEPSTSKVDAQALEKIDWWIKCLRDEGIYVFLGLHNERRFKPGDNIEHFSELLQPGVDGEVRGYNYVNPSIQAAMDRFAQQYLEHRNTHTGLRYIDDPAVVGVQITNENDFTHHFGNRLLPDKGVPRHTALFRAASDRFAAKHGLPVDRTWRTWEHGPSKLFVNDQEFTVHQAAAQKLRALGLRTTLSSTSAWGNGPLSSLPALLAGDVVDAHAYGFVGELERNPFFKPTLVHWLAAAHVAGRPLTVTEWNVESFPAPDRHAAPIYVAATAAHQGWDAMMLYAYGQGSLNDAGKPGNWDAFNDPALMVTNAAAALLFRQAHVREATSVYAYAPSAEQLFNQEVSPEKSVALRTAVERGKLVIALPATKELPWLTASTIPAGAKVIRDPNAAQLPAGATSATSDNGELTRDWGVGTFVVNTPRTQSANGWLGGRTVALANVEVALKNPHAAVAVQGLDGAPIIESKRILITTATVALPKPGAGLPFLSAPVEGVITVQASPGLRLFAVGADGAKAQPPPATYADGRYRITLTAQRATDWLILRAP